jgi:hypothetical protein
MTIFLTIILLQISSSYACNYKDNGDGTRTDLQNGLVWQSNGVGSGDWYFAMNQAKISNVNGMKDWRLPTKNELSNFMSSGCSANSPKYLWSTTIDGNAAWIAYVEQGRMSNIHTRKGSKADVLLVRAGQKNEQAEYDVQYSKLEEQAAENARQDAERIRQAAIEQARQREANKKENARQQEANKLFNKQLASKKPQEMYIAAGKYEAKKDYERATKLYDAIVERFPDHDMAIKATDRLTSLRDVENVRRSNEETANEATRNAKSMARQACQNEVNACYSRGGSVCYRNCDY